MQQNLHYNQPVALNSATDLPVMLQTQQTLYPSWPVAGATEPSAQQTLHYNGPATRCVDFLRPHRR